MISKNRPTKGKIGTPFHIERIYQSKQSCKNCIYYEKEDRSCAKIPIVLSEVGIDYYKSCKYFEVRQGKNEIHYKEKKIARVIRATISNNGNLKLAAKSFGISLYQALVIYNKTYGDLMPRNEVNINKLRKYGLSNKKIAEFYGVNESVIYNQNNLNYKLKMNNNIKNYKNQVSSTNKNAIILKEVSEDICVLCNKKDKASKIYYIDNNKIDDKDSILNMVNLCKCCEEEVRKNRSKYEEILKQRADEIMEMVMILI